MQCRNYGELFLIRLTHHRVGEWFRGKSIIVVLIYFRKAQKIKPLQNF